MSIHLLVNLQIAYLLAALLVAIGAVTVFFLRTLDDHATGLMLRLSAALGATALTIAVSALFMVQEFLALGMHLANFGIVCGVIAVAEITRRQLGLRKRTALMLSLMAAAALAFLVAYDPARPLMGNALRHGFEALIGLALALRLMKLTHSSTPVLKKMIAWLALLYAGDALFELANSLSNDLVFRQQGGSLVIGLPQTIGIASTSVLSGLFIALLLLTVNAHMANRLRHLLSTDELTRLGSRRGLLEQGPAFLQRSAQGGQAMAVMMVDIDHFKRINDRYGHPVGDAILKHCARVMRASLRPEAMLARYGGEEFCALVPLGQWRDALVVADRLREQVQTHPFKIVGFEIGCTVSIGVALVHQDLALDACIAQADEALYRAKRNGRNQVVIHGQPAAPASLLPLQPTPAPAAPDRLVPV